MGEVQTGRGSPQSVEDTGVDPLTLGEHPTPGRSGWGEYRTRRPSPGESPWDSGHSNLRRPVRSGFWSAPFFGLECLVYPTRCGVLQNSVGFRVYPATETRCRGFGRHGLGSEGVVWREVVKETRGFRWDLRRDRGLHWTEGLRGSL